MNHLLKTLLLGGEDYHLRLWSIKSGELLFDDKFMDSIPSVVRWPKTEGITRLCFIDIPPSIHLYFPVIENVQFMTGILGMEKQIQGAWIGSEEGLFFMDWP